MIVADIPVSLLDAALKLPDEVRAAFADRLYESLDESNKTDSESAWSDEIQRRIDELRSGKEKALPLDEAWKVILDDSDGGDAD
jgi:putative addiction module component (TIGR02574 family)